MRIVGVIPARWAASRFPGKSIVPICGKPLVRWVVETCLEADSLDEVILATDDERIASAVKGSGAGVVMTRPDHPSGTDRVAEAAAAEDGDIIINIQGDEPLIEPELINGIADVLRREGSLEMATAATPIGSLEELMSPDVVKVVLDGRNRALYFSRLPIPCRRDGTPDPEDEIYRRHIGIYGYRGAFLNRLVETPPCRLEELERLEQLRALYLGAGIAVVDCAAAGVGVDRPEDVAIVEALLKERCK